MKSSIQQKRNSPIVKWCIKKIIETSSRKKSASDLRNNKNLFGLKEQWQKVLQFDDGGVVL